MYKSIEASHNNMTLDEIVNSDDHLLILSFASYKGRVADIWEAFQSKNIDDKKSSSFICDLLAHGFIIKKSRKGMSSWDNFHAFDSGVIDTSDFRTHPFKKNDRIYINERKSSENILLKDALERRFGRTVDNAKDLYDIILPDLIIAYYYSIIGVQGIKVPDLLGVSDFVYYNECHTISFTGGLSSVLNMVQIIPKTLHGYERHHDILKMVAKKISLELSYDFNKIIGKTLGKTPDFVLWPLKPVPNVIFKVLSEFDLNGIPIYVNENIEKKMLYDKLVYETDESLRTFSDSKDLDKIASNVLLHRFFVEWFSGV